jgi:hypothetical protein
MNNETKEFFALLALGAAICTLFVITGARANEEIDCVSPTHCVLLSLPPWHEDIDEPANERWDRLKVVADGVDAATGSQVKRAFLVMTADEESRLARFVHHDLEKCREGIGGWCDNGTSYSPWQLKRMTRDETIAESATVALRRFEVSSNQCSAQGFDPIEGGISLYGTGKTCKWANAPARAEKLWRIHWMLGSQRK